MKDKYLNQIIKLARNLLKVAFLSRQVVRALLFYNLKFLRCTEIAMCCNHQVFFKKNLPVFKNLDKIFTFKTFSIPNLLSQLLKAKNLTQLLNLPRKKSKYSSNNLLEMELPNLNHP